jgi:hypothetical protein
MKRTSQIFVQRIRDRCGQYLPKQPQGMTVCRNEMSVCTAGTVLHIWQVCEWLNGRVGCAYRPQWENGGMNWEVIKARSLTHADRVTPWNRAPPQVRIIRSHNQEIRNLLRKLKAQYCVYKSPPPVPILGQMRQIYRSISPKTHFI